jgi:hypothetical protein
VESVFKKMSLLHVFVVVHGAVPHGAVQCNHGAVPHGAMQKGSDCEIFTDLVYFALKFPKRVNCSHFYSSAPMGFHDTAKLPGCKVRRIGTRDTEQVASPALPH